MKRTVLNVQQGTHEWLAARAASDGTASEAPAMMGHGKYQTRTDLLDQRKHGISKDVDAGTQALFDRGHEAEALARPIAEEIIGEELSPTTVVLEIDGMKLLASLDGITFDDEAIWEHKLYSESLAEQISSGNLDEHYTIQMDQELLVSGAKKCLFMTSDGTKEKCEWMWYESSQEKFDAIIAGWKQFHKDLATHEQRQIKEAPKAEPVESFPVPAIQVRGELVSCNLQAITPVFDKFLAEANTELKTDEDFAQGEADAKASREAAKTLKLKAKEVVDQIAPVSEVVRTLETYAAKFDALGLKLEKAVKEQKESIKGKIAMEARAAFQAHVMTLEAEIFPIRMQLDTPDFGGAMKGMRTIASLHNAVDTLLAQSKIAADEAARDLRAKLAWYNEHAAEKFLFHDLQQLIGKPMDDFQLVVTTRIEQHKKAEAEKLEAERERIRLEEEAKAKREAERKEAEAAAVQQAVTTGLSVVKQAVENDQVKVQHIPTEEVIDTGATMKLGQICDRLGFSLPADFIRSLGIEPVGRERAAVLYRESDFPKICDSLIARVQAARNHAIEELRKAA